MNPHVKTIGFLFSAGFLGGGFISGGAVHRIDVAAHAAMASGSGSGNESMGQGAAAAASLGTAREPPAALESGSGGGSAAASGGDDKKPAPAATPVQAAEAAPQPTSSAPQPQKMPDVQPPKPAPAPEVASNKGRVRVSGHDAIAFIAGNTLDSGAGLGKQRYTFFSTKGLRGDGDERGFTVHRWTERRNQLCETSDTGTVSCKTIEIVADKEPSGKPGDKIGTLQSANSGAVDILRGNVARFPATLPLIDDMPTRTGSLFGGKLSATGAPAIEALIERSLRLNQSVVDLGGPHGLLYGRDHQVIEARMFSGTDSTKGGIVISVGSWTATNGLLCETKPEQTSETCFRPESWGPASFRLVPTGLGMTKSLSVMNRATPDKNLGAGAPGSAKSAKGIDGATPVRLD